MNEVIKKSYKGYIPSDSSYCARKWWLLNKNMRKLKDSAYSGILLFIQIPIPGVVISGFISLMWFHCFLLQLLATLKNLIFVII